MVGRGCLGRPWLFADLEAAFAGRPDAGDCRRWARSRPSCAGTPHLLVDALGDEQHGCTDFRKHVAWYLKGFPVGGDLRRSLAMVSSLAELDDLLGKLDPDEPFPASRWASPAAGSTRPGKVSLPYGWLDSRDDDTVPEGAEMDDSGG